MASPSPLRLSPPAIPMELHSLNREKLFNSLREHLTSCARPLQGFVLLQGGEEQTRDSTDHLELFRQESYFAYLFGVIEPGFYGAIGIEKFQTDLNTLHPILTECRVVKSDLELALIQFANDISSEAHVEVMRKTKVGMKEYQLESMFLHHIYMYGGCRHCSYTCICATGNNRLLRKLSGLFQKYFLPDDQGDDTVVHISADFSSLVEVSSVTMLHRIHYKLNTLYFGLLPSETREFC